MRLFFCFLFKLILVLEGANFSLLCEAIKFLFLKDKWLLFPLIGQSVSLDEKMKIAVPDDRYGLYAIDVLDPDMVPNLFTFQIHL